MGQYCKRFPPPIAALIVPRYTSVRQAEQGLRRSGLLTGSVRELQSPILKRPDNRGTIPLNDTARTYLAYAGELDEAVRATIASGWWINGPRNEAFAEAFSRYVGVAHCQPVANGTDALELALRGLLECGRAIGSEVVTVANAGGYTTTACAHVGLRPVYADIEYETQLVDIAGAVRALSGETAAVVATHLYGGVVDVVALRAAMDAAGYAKVPIVEDCAQAHGAMLGNVRVGALGDVATFSFYPTKNLGAVGDAGAVVTSDETLFATVKQLAQYGWSRKYEVTRAGGRNSRMDEVQAAVLSTLLPHLDALNARRQAILETYASANANLVFARPASGTVAHLAVARTSSRDAFREHMKQHGIATDIHYPILDCDQPGWMSEVTPELPVSRASTREIVTVPCFPFMTDAEVERVADAMSQWGRA